MEKTIKINGVWLPDPDGNITVKASKVKTEQETEAGTTMVIVTRPTKLSISGSWKVSGAWIEYFRAWRAADAVLVEIYYPLANELTEYECQLEVTKEEHISKARTQMPTKGGLYEIEVKITEL